MLRKVMRVKYSNPNRNLNFLASFIQNESEDEGEMKFKKAMRAIFSRILREKSINEIVRNNRVAEKDKKWRLIASKVFSLRCMKSNLTSRIESA